MTNELKYIMYSPQYQYILKPRSLKKSRIPWPPQKIPSEWKLQTSCHAILLIVE